MTRQFGRLALSAAGVVGLLLAACHDREDRLPPGKGKAGSGGHAGADATGAAGEPVEPEPAGGAAGTPSVGDAGNAGEAAGGAGDAVPTAPTYPGYTLVIDEQFDAPLDLNHDPVWTWGDGGYMTNVRFVEDAITFGEGTMTITTRAVPERISSSHSFADNSTVGTSQIASGELRTKFNNYRYGRYEARFRTLRPGAPPMNTLLLSSLLVSRTPRLEQWREISLDVSNGDGLLTGVFYGDEQPYSGLMRTGRAITTEPIDQYHDYVLVWTASSVQWFVDDVLVSSYEAPATPGRQAPPIPDASTKIMLNAWVSINPFAAGTGTTADWFPFTTEYDYFRFYKQDDETYPCLDTPACLPAEDLNLSKNNLKETDTEG